jgi:hypothetical protein
LFWRTGGEKMEKLTRNKVEDGLFDNVNRDIILMRLGFTRSQINSVNPEQANTAIDRAIYLYLEKNPQITEFLHAFAQVKVMNNDGTINQESSLDLLQRFIQVTEQQKAVKECVDTSIYFRMGNTPEPEK